MFSYCYLCWMVMMVCGFRETMWVSWWLDCHTDMKTVLTLLSGNHCLLVLCGQRHAEALSLLECPAWIGSRTVHSSYWYNYHCCGNGCHSKLSYEYLFELINTAKVCKPSHTFWVYWHLQSVCTSRPWKLFQILFAQGTYTASDNAPE